MNADQIITRLVKENKDIKAALTHFKALWDIEREECNDLHEVLKTIQNISHKKGRHNCTYGDTHFDSQSVAYGFNICLEYIKSTITKAKGLMKIRTIEDEFQYRVHHILKKMNRDYEGNLPFNEWLETGAGSIELARKFLDDIDEYCGLKEVIENEN